MRKLVLLSFFSLACDVGGGPQRVIDADVTILRDGIPDAGLDAGPDAGLDAGVPADVAAAEYDGEAEPGVRCGDDLTACAEDALCCVAFNGVAAVARCGGSCAVEERFTFACDGDEECDGQLCCLAGDLVSGIHSTCEDAATCSAVEGSQICHNSSECGDGESCCGIVGISLPLDVGVCARGCAP